MGAASHRDHQYCIETISTALHRAADFAEEELKKLLTEENWIILAAYFKQKGCLISLENKANLAQICVLIWEGLS